MAKIVKVTEHNFRALAKAQTREVLLADFRRLAEIASGAAAFFTPAQMRELVGIVEEGDAPADDGSPLPLKNYGRRVSEYMARVNKGYGQPPVFSAEDIRAARLGEVG